MELKKGTLLNNRYIIERLISKEGGFSLVYSASDLKGLKRVVIKELAPSGMIEREKDKLVVKDEYKFKDLIEVFRSEGELLKGVKHENIIEYIDSFEENNTYYIVMEYGKGKNLKEYVKKKQGLDLVEAMDIFGKVLDTVEHLHNDNILHRDIKPANIIVDKNQVKLIDFGSACKLEEKDDDIIRVSKGYSPIEMYATESKHSFGTDIYSAFATLYFMLEGKKPLSAPERVFDNKLNFEKDIDEAFRLLITKNMNMLLGDRDTNIERVREKLLIDGLNTRVEEIRVDKWEIV